MRTADLTTAEQRDRSAAMLRLAAMAERDPVTIEQAFERRMALWAGSWRTLYADLVVRIQRGDLAWIEGL